MLEYIVTAITELIKFNEFNKTQLKHKSEVVSALKEAYRCTKKHVELTRKNDGDIPSEELVEKWGYAAKMVRPFDENLGQLLEQKSDYWSNPYSFKQEIRSNERRFDFQFTLIEMNKKIKHLEKNWKKL